MSSAEPTRCYHCHAEVEIRRDVRGKWRPFNLDGSTHDCAEFHRNAKKQVSRGLDDLEFPEISRDLLDRMRTRRKPAGAGDRVGADDPTTHGDRIFAQEPKPPTIPEPALQEVPAEYDTGDLLQSETDEGVGLVPSPSRRGRSWTREEILLATDLYLRHQGVLFGPKHPEVIELSKILNRLPLHPFEYRNDRFRNPNGVALKLSNIRAVDPHARSKGNVNGSKLDGIYWTELRGNPAALGREIAAIKQRYPQAFERERALAEPGLEEDPEVVSPIGRRHEPEPVVQRPTPPPPSAVRRGAASAERSGAWTWKPTLDELTAQPWFRSLRKDDPRFEWFVRKFRGYVRPRVLYLHEWIETISASSLLARGDRADVEEAMLRFHDYVHYLHGLALEDELFSIVSASTDADFVPQVLRDLQWDGEGRAGDSVSLHTTMLLHSLQRGWYWTPALERALAVLQREGIRDPRLFGPTLRHHGVTRGPLFSARALSFACTAFGKPIPAIVAEMDDA